MKDITAVSLWLNDEPATRIESGRLMEKKSQSHKVVKIPLVELRSRDLPTDLTDFCITVSTVDGEVIHSEVIDYRETKAQAMLTIAGQAGMILPQTP